LIVASHERSGTHFLMNSLAKAFGYLARPWINFDYELGINFYYRKHVRDFFGLYDQHNVANITKSHHCFGFFDPVMADMPRGFIFFYIHRDPIEVMRSFHKFMHHWYWHEGPRTKSLAEFVRAAPEGLLMRYQQDQHRNMLQRWAAHVDGWCEAAQRHDNIVTLSYRQLSQDYAGTIARIAEVLDSSPKNLEPPDRNTNTIASANLEIDQALNSDLSREDLDFIDAEVGDTVRKWQITRRRSAVVRLGRADRS
jgi:hypothetical protein